MTVRAEMMSMMMCMCRMCKTFDAPASVIFPLR